MKKKKMKYKKPRKPSEQSSIRNAERVCKDKAKPEKKKQTFDRKAEKNLTSICMTIGKEKNKDTGSDVHDLCITCIHTALLLQSGPLCPLSILVYSSCSVAACISDLTFREALTSCLRRFSMTVRPSSVSQT